MLYEYDDDDSIVFGVVSIDPVLECDACLETRPINGLTIIGEMHGCPRLGAFRLKIPAQFALHIILDDT